jgi:circadian clock protein KaiC
MKQTGSQPLARLSTGIPGLDAVLGGGLPAGSISVLAGEPGSGKTVLALQVLFHAARAGKRTLYFSTLSEPSLKLIRHLQGFRFFDAALLDREVTFVDLGGALRGRDARAAGDLVARRVEEAEPSVVVIDSFRALHDFAPDASAARALTYDLAVHMASWGATTLLVGEYGRDDAQRLPEFGIADGILRLGTEAQELARLRELEVQKLRGSTFVPGIHYFDIDADGIAFYPRVRAPDVGDPPAARSAETPPLSTGVAQLDVLLRGGLPRGSATTVMGGTGTGKTLLGLQFLVEGARRDEAGALFTLEETPGQIRDIARGFAFGFDELEARGLLHLRYAAPIELSTDRFLHQVREEVARLGVRRLVLDSLTSLGLGAASERRYKELVYALSKHMRALGVTLVTTMEISELLGAGQLSGHGVSFAADNVLQLRYVERRGRLERAISVLKARGVPHLSELRGLTIGPAGVVVSEDIPYAGHRGILTGLPQPSEEPG